MSIICKFPQDHDQHSGLSALYPDPSSLLNDQLDTVHLNQAHPLKGTLAPLEVMR